MSISEIINWAGLICFAIGCICLSMIGIRNSVWFGPNRSLLQEWRPLDKKLGKTSILIFCISGILFGIATKF